MTSLLRVVLAIMALALSSWATAQPCGQGSLNETLTRGSGHLYVNLYLPAIPLQDHASVVREIVGREVPHIEYVAKPDRNRLPKGPWAYSILVTDPKVLPRPDPSFLEFKGRTLSETERAAAGAPRALLALGFVIPVADFESNFRQANRAAALVAESFGALIADDDTRDIYSVASWREARISDAGTPLKPYQHITVHLYRQGDYLRAVTLGMSKFGLPDLVIAELHGPENRPASALMEVLVQRLYEAPTKLQQGRLTLALSDLRHQALRKQMEKSLQPGGRGEGVVCLSEARPEPGDANNRLLRIGFDLSTGADRHEKRLNFFVTMFGISETDIIGARSGDAELLAASRRAREQIPVLRAAVKSGLKPNEQVFVKAPFSEAGQTEFMWIHVARWEGGRIRGVLTSTPRSIRTVRFGQEVDVAESDFYDYIRRHPDGKSEGNETGKILEARSRR